MVKLKLQYFVHLIQRTDSLEKILMLGKVRRQEVKGTIEDEMVGWHDRCNGHEFEWALGVGDGQGGLVYFSPGIAKSQTLLSDWTELMLTVPFLLSHLQCTRVPVSPHLC